VLASGGGMGGYTGGVARKRTLLAIETGDDARDFYRARGTTRR
jgi:hypothetical protein